MIQKWIKNELSAIIPHLEWSMDYKTGKDDTGVVYNESPGDPSKDDFVMLYPNYMVEIETSKRSEIESMAWKVYDAMNKRNRTVAIISDELSFEVIFIHAIPPLPVGIEGKKMTYTINLQATIRRIKNN